MKDDLLNLYLDGRLGPDEARRVDEALERDASVRARFESLLATREAIQEAFAVPTDLPDFDEVWSGVEARLDVEPVPEAALPSLVDRWFSWLFQPAFAMAGAAALVAAIVAGAWIASGPDDVAPSGADPVRLAANAPANPVAVTPGARRELPSENGRRGMVGEQQAKRSLAIVESFEVDKGVVVVSAPTGSAKRPLVIWHLVPGEELQDDEEVMP